MNFIPLSIPDVVLLTPKVFGDERGFFMETFRQSEFEEHCGAYRFVQDNHSLSGQGILRGLHYQLEKPQGKLVRVTRGEVFDVAVDLRRSSPTFGRWVGATLSAENKQQLWALALEALVKGEKQGALAYNLGNGEGYSVQEVIDLARKVVGEDGRTITVEEGERRPGDPARLVTDTTLASRELGWNPVYADLEPIIRHAWVWEKKLSGDGVA